MTNDKIIFKTIRRVSSFMSRQNLLLIYNSLVEQRLNYCSEVWDTLSDGLSQKLQKLQNRAARIITKSAYDASSSELLVELRLLMSEELKKLS
jgi:hypothetical protein